MTVVRVVYTAAFQEVLGSFYAERAETIGGTYVEDLLKALEKME